MLLGKSASVKPAAGQVAQGVGWPVTPTHSAATALKMNMNLRELYLADNKLNGLQDSAQLGNLLKFNCSLQILDLRNNHVLDSGAPVCPATPSPAPSGPRCASGWVVLDTRVASSSTALPGPQLAGRTAVPLTVPAPTGSPCGRASVSLGQRKQRSLQGRERR